MWRRIRDGAKALLHLWATGTPHQRRLILLLALLGVGLAGVAGLWGYYLTTRKPLSAVLPSAPAVAEVFKPRYLFSIYGVDRPVGVAVSPDGERIYVAESGGERKVHVFDRKGERLFTMATADTLAERTPVYVEVDGQGRIFVSDRRQHTVFLFDPEGNPLGQMAPPPGETFWAPLGIALGPERIYLTDITRGMHRVLVYTQDGQFVQAFGTEGKDPGQFWYPNGIEVDPEGRIYVTDSNNGRLQVFDASGELLYRLGGFNLPRGTAMDDQQRLYVVDAVGQRVVVYGLFAQPIELLFDFGDLGLGDGQFNYPNDIAVDTTGRLYIADRENNRIQVWSY